MFKIESIKSQSPQVAIDKERKATKFDINKMFEFLESGKDEAALTKSLMQQIERDTILKTNASYYDLTKDQHRELTAQKIARLASYIEKDAPFFENFQKRLNLIAIVDPQLGTRVGVHLGLFLSAIRGNGTEEQFKYWAFERGAAYLKDVYGCFGMTELAHGSNVAGLETTATFDQKTKEFEINTPHLGATKWWIGGAAHSANHCVVYARLIVSGKDYGVKTFVVPIRDRNHNLHSGVAIGDIGAKMGRDGIDNGWIQLTNVRIPMNYMRSKFTKVTQRQEIVEVPPLEQLAYGALLGGRVTMVTDSFRMAQRFITIALRYSVGRRQFGAKNSSEELKLIDYPLHQRRLLPYLALTYALSISSFDLSQTYDSVLSNLDAAGKSQDFSKLGQAIAGLKNLFCASASLKSTATWYVAQLIDECRQACGGHGYSSYSGFGKAYNDWVVQCTWEGDNNILASNAGRLLCNLLSSCKKKEKKIKGDLSYLNGISNIDKEAICWNKQSMTNLSNSNIDKELFCFNKQVCTVKLINAIQGTIIRLGVRVPNIGSKKSTWDDIAAQRVVLSKLNAVLYMLQHLVLKIKQLGDEEAHKQYLVQIAALFATSQIEMNFASYFLQFKAIDSLEPVADVVSELCLSVRDQVIGLTDSFQFSDYFINSALGSHSGDIYNTYFDTVNNLNNPQVRDGKAAYSEALEAMLRRDPLEVRECFEKSDKVLKKLAPKI
uniref:Acyl-coenzyme A oxidase n=1 Tax=Komagataella pastoris TaxID=4922 RepID=ACOX_PICPA|nr:RecName: Full=Acyl-coenzyme A oxidase; Short=Acyl-CoA oxidase [Komagataella pastoris]AAD31029.1 acyl-coenzyme A oxidase [Komagataella pastoris]